MTHRISVVALLACLAALALAAAGQARHLPSSGPLPKLTVSGCTGSTAARPASWQTGCGLCNTFYSAARWSSWGTAEARGTATRRATRLRPYPDTCAQAYERARPRRVSIRLSNPERCGGKLIFTVLTARWRGHVVVDRGGFACYE